MHTTTDNEILVGLARVLGFDPEDNRYESAFGLMFPIIMRDWETLGENFEPYYGALADHAGLDPEQTIKYVLSITRHRSH